MNGMRDQIWWMVHGCLIFRQPQVYTEMNNYWLLRMLMGTWRLTGFKGLGVVFMDSWIRGQDTMIWKLFRFWGSGSWYRTMWDILSLHSCDDLLPMVSPRQLSVCDPTTILRALVAPYSENASLTCGLWMFMVDQSWYGDFHKSRYTKMNGL